jgi:hypothetical protein
VSVRNVNILNNSLQKECCKIAKYAQLFRILGLGPYRDRIIFYRRISSGPRCGEGVKPSYQICNTPQITDPQWVPVWPAPQMILLHPQVENPGKRLFIELQATKKFVQQFEELYPGPFTCINPLIKWYIVLHMP